MVAVSGFSLLRSPSPTSEEDRDKSVAIKLFNKDFPEKKIMREAAPLQKAQGHPNVVKLMEFVVGGEDAQHALVIHFHSGGDLVDCIRWQRPSLREALLLIRGLFSALAPIHALRVVHRDVKAGNVLIGPQSTAVLADFGEAASMGCFPGTPG